MSVSQRHLCMSWTEFRDTHSTPGFTLHQQEEVISHISCTFIIIIKLLIMHIKYKVLNIEESI